MLAVTFLFTVLVGLAAGIPQDHKLTDPDTFLRIKCHSSTLYRQHSPACARFLNLTTTTNAPALSTINITVAIVHTPTSTNWPSIIFPLISAALGLYSALVAYLKYKLKYNYTRALTLGLHGRAQNFNANAHDLPVPLDTV